MQSLISSTAQTRSLPLRIGILSVVTFTCSAALAAGGGAGTGAKPTESTKTYDYYLTGSAANMEVAAPKSNMVVLMGGGEDVDDAFKDMFSQAGCDPSQDAGGTPLDIVILRTSGADGYNPYLMGLGLRKDGSSCVDSVETLVIKSRDAANDIGNVVSRVNKADVLFIAGGDQSTYIKLWSGTRLDQTIQDLIAQRKVPIGGTSAGMAVLGAVDYSGENGSITSTEAMSNPYDAKLTLRTELLAAIPFMASTVTDTHLYERDRMGRLITFMARMGKDNIGATWSTARGIGITQATALVVKDGIGKVRYQDVTVTDKKGNTSTTLSKQSVYFLNWINSNGAGFTVEPKQALNFNAGYLQVQTLTGCDKCSFDLSRQWSGSGTSTRYPYVQQGSLFDWSY